MPDRVDAHVKPVHRYPHKSAKNWHNRHQPAGHVLPAALGATSGSGVPRTASLTQSATGLAVIVLYVAAGGDPMPVCGALVLLCRDLRGAWSGWRAGAGRCGSW